MKERGEHKFAQVRQDEANEETVTNQDILSCSPHQPVTLPHSSSLLPLRIPTLEVTPTRWQPSPVPSKTPPATHRRSVSRPPASSPWTVFVVSLHLRLELSSTKLKLFPFDEPSPDEVLQLVLNELDDPTSFSRVSKRFSNFTQDPYVRASYFLARHGKLQALFYAFGRGKLVTERVIDVRALILPSSHRLPLHPSIRHNSPRKYRL